MLHHIAPDLGTYVGSRKIIWTSLEDGDEAAIGPYTLRIGLGRREIQTKEETAPEATAPVEYSVNSSQEQRQLGPRRLALATSLPPTP